jgi:hypothetical protein
MMTRNGFDQLPEHLIVDTGVIVGPLFLGGIGSDMQNVPEQQQDPLYQQSVVLSPLLPLLQ